jgi:hypothetical protein
VPQEAFWTGQAATSDVAVHLTTARVTMWTDFPNETTGQRKIAVETAQSIGRSAGYSCVFQRAKVPRSGCQGGSAQGSSCSTGMAASKAASCDRSGHFQGTSPRAGVAVHRATATLRPTASTAAAANGKGWRPPRQLQGKDDGGFHGVAKAASYVPVVWEEWQ